MLCPSYLRPSERDRLCLAEARKKILEFLFQGLISGTHLYLLWQ